MTTQRFRHAVIACLAMLVISLASVSTSAYAQLTPCPNCYVDIQSNHTPAPNVFPLLIALNTPTSTGFAYPFNSVGNSTMPAYAAPSSATIYFPDGSHVDVPFDMSPPFDDATPCYTGSDGKVHCFSITCYFDLSGCPHIHIFIFS